MQVGIDITFQKRACMVTSFGGIDIVTPVLVGLRFWRYGYLSETAKNPFWVHGHGKI